MIFSICASFSEFVTSTSRIVSSKALPLGAAVFTLPLFWSTGMMKIGVFPFAVWETAFVTRVSAIPYTIFATVLAVAGAISRKS